MKWMAMSLLLVLSITACRDGATPETAELVVEKPTLRSGMWRVVMKSPGGDLPFGLEVSQVGQGYRAVAINGDERLPFDTVAVAKDRSVLFAVEHYESQFEGKLSEDGLRIEGEWTKVAGTDEISRLKFYAEHGVDERFKLTSETPADLNGRWAVTFHNNDDPDVQAVGEFVQNGTDVTGTFLTPTGDYRFLAGVVDGDKMYLSCFDGGHAFLFTATLDDQGQLNGDFWSRDTWHETWAATRDENATLPDAYTQTGLVEGAPTFRFSFPDLEGNILSHDGPELDGKVRVVTIFGSWCPNCNDEAPFLQELYERYGDRGLEVIGLAFEMTDDTDRNIKVLERFKKRHKLTYRILLAGNTKDKAKVTEIVGDLTEVLSYPTTLFIDRSGKVSSIHTGFTGPGTGMYYEKLRREYQEKIAALLGS